MTGTGIAVKPILLAAGGGVPNNPRLPLLFYPGLDGFRGAGATEAFERAFAANGWGGLWRNGIYAYHHYHSNAHEALGIARGTARVQFGGDTGPVLDVAAGDAAVIPAGVGHCRLSSSADLLVIGAYPPGQEADLIRADRTSPAVREAARQEIVRVPLPAADPLFGREGPLLQHWR